MSIIPEFTHEEGNFLIRLFLAHMLSDFVFQTKKMVENKRWNSWGMLSHIGLTMLTVFALTGNLPVVILTGITHYLIDVSKIALSGKYPDKKLPLFFADQLVHMLALVLIWAWDLGKVPALITAIWQVMTDYNLSLVFAGYVFCIWPSAYIVKFVVQNLLRMEHLGKEENEKVQNGGRWIGQFERVLIFTFVLLSEYSAIGFLITGKSIIRFADKEYLKTEYVLAGTLLSFLLAIISGVLVTYFRIK